MSETVIDFLRIYRDYAVPLVFALGFAESIALVSLFVPSTALFLVIGTAHASTGGIFWHVWLAGALGAIIGDILSYGGGRYFKEDALKVWPLSRYPDLMPRGKVLMHRWGWLSVLAGKFTGFMRPFIPIIAGILLMRFALFIFASTLSSLAWAGVFLAPGYGIKILMN